MIIKQSQPVALFRIAKVKYGIPWFANYTSRNLQTCIPNPDLGQANTRNNWKKKKNTRFQTNPNQKILRVIRNLICANKKAIRAQRERGAVPVRNISPRGIRISKRKGIMRFMGAHISFSDRHRFLLHLTFETDGRDRGYAGDADGDSDHQREKHLFRVAVRQSERRRPTRDTWSRWL